MPDNNLNPANAPGTGPANEPAITAERTFTQAEVDALIGRRLAKAMKGMPGEDELARFRAWESTQKAQQDTVTAITQERDNASAALATANAELEQLKRERILLEKGVSAEDVEYYAYKIGKLVTKDLTFEAAAEQYFADKSPRGTVRVSTAASLGGGQQPKTENDAMNALIRSFRR